MEVEPLFHSLPNYWETVTLSEACKRGGGDIQTGPFGSQLHASDYVPVGIPSIMPKNIGENRVDTTDIARITAEDAKRLSRYLVKPGDIVYSRRGDVERRALIREEEDGWLCGTGCLRIRLGKGIVNPLYAFYYLGHPSIRDWIVRHAIGATMPNLNTSILSSLPFVVPHLDEQKAIAHILGTLDDKIELNQQMNHTLEAIARALFKSWFIDFDPVRAKMDGRQPAGMDAETAALFPAEFENSAIGKIPKNWKVKPIGDVVRAVGGATPSTSEAEYWEGGTIYWSTPKDLASLSSPVLLDTERRITEKGLQKISSGLLPKGTVLLSSRAPIGYLAIAEVPLAINQGYIAMVCDQELSNHYVLRWTQINMGIIEGRANGTTFMEISKKNFRAIPVLVPSQQVLEAFNEQAESIHQQVANNFYKNKTLTSIRNALLPKLLSGKIRVKNIEVKIEGEDA
ncbi:MULTISPECIES: restriction endonuclease subunit S [unclassified Microcoleus]|uniref:restriction endonuclease subunit S n=1 Tax=unclassified Microcoleus TaxID=2642155 RepID=UPI002FD66F71